MDAIQGRMAQEFFVHGTVKTSHELSKNEFICTTHPINTSQGKLVRLLGETRDIACVTDSKPRVI